MSPGDPAPADATRIPLPRLSEREANRRSLSERLLVRFPGPSTRLLAAVLRLPRGSRVRRQVVTDWVTRAYAAANRRDFAVLLAGIDPAHEYRPSREIMPPDLGGPTKGREGYVRMWRYWLDAFEDIRYEPDEVLDFGEKLLVTVRQVGHGSGSGVGLSKPVFQLLTVRRGRTVMQEDFVDRDEAIRAARA